MVIGVYDYDFFNYENVIPNLECAKLITYFRQHQQIAALSPSLNPGPYTRFMIRKEYDDGIYPREIFLPNCVYGGRAFNPARYIPLDGPIEKTVPNMHIYDQYIDHFGKKNTELIQIKRILNCAHIRLAPDSKNLLTFEELQPNFEDKVTGIFLHDYDLSSLHAYDLIEQLQNQRQYITRKGINPYPVGNKYPINVYNSEELEKWMKIVTIPNAFFLEYHGYMTDNTLYKLCVNNRRMARQIYYDIAYGCSDENDFLINRLPKIFTQVLFLRRSHVKILLNYKEDFFLTEELKNLIELLNCWLSFQWQEDFVPNSQTLYMFCYHNSKLHYTTWEFRTIRLSFDEIQDSFQYIREKNYNLFKLFYEWDSVQLQGGEFRNEWTGNKRPDS